MMFVRICEHNEKHPYKLVFLYLGHVEICCIFKTRCSSSLSFYTKCLVLHEFMFLCWNSIFFIKYMLKCKYQPGHLGVKLTIQNTPGEYQQFFPPHFDRGESVRMDLCQFVMHSESVGHHRALNCRLWEVWAVQPSWTELVKFVTGIKSQTLFPTFSFIKWHEPFYKLYDQDVA